MIAVIGEAMTFVMHQFVAHAKKGFKWTFVGAFDEGRNRAMMMKGWCPFTMRILQENMCTAGYASTCKPYVRQGAGLSTHDSCSSDGCIVNTIDTSNYSNRHIDNSCQCTHSRPSLEGVVSKLDNWQIPVVSFHCGSSASNTSDLSCVSALDTPFVAISHVWADGLGSTTEHGLPMCQVQRLEILVRQLRVNGGAFWIDALCIPERNESRKRAIGLMGQTYKNAAAVLVIDSGIRTCSVSAPLEEKLLRVLTSGWMQRVWTLQEALLAKKLAFEFSDGLLTIDELLPQGRDTLDFLKVTLVIEIMRLLKRQEYGQLGESFGLGDVARSLRWRTTSRLSDETLAISSLLDVDAYELAGLPANERMKALLLRVGKVASNIIFLSGPKIDSPGFQWAPATFMVRGARAELNTTRKDAICTPAGLISKYAYIAFKQTTFEAKERWCLRENSAGPKFSVDDSEREDSSGSRIAKDYTCSALLFDGSLPKPHQMQGAVAVLAPASCCDSEAGRETRMECVYIRRVLVTWLVEDEVKRHAGLTTLDIQSSGTLEFCIS
ncbi:hypothetical protein CERSUDRAFT_110334 [Gelatoporia subvermispora B]|uniref:Heterokaryon incompatibility domain-containing protein n=1 Tax=Ceriporiopsis subvermispora (strain B) TaxID=914234 RepID=M2RBD1_CERS8|nr:hypothetical protein CERSUDRAFT_110334 [Gelatoporia subvermispora B]